MKGGGKERRMRNGRAREEAWREEARKEGLGMVGGGRRHGGRMRWEIEGRYMERDEAWRKGKRLGGSDEARRNRLGIRVLEWNGKA